MPTASAPAFDPVTVLFALGSPMRWAMVLWILSRGPMTAKQLSEVLKADYEGTVKHLAMLRDAGVLTVHAGEDRRNRFYDLPASTRTTPGLIDFGFCVLRTDRMAAKAAPQS